MSEVNDEHRGDTRMAVWSHERPLPSPETKARAAALLRMYADLIEHEHEGLPLRVFVADERLNRHTPPVTFDGSIPFPSYGTVLGRQFRVTVGWGEPEDSWLQDVPEWRYP